MTIYVSGTLAATKNEHENEQLQSCIANVCKTLGFETYFPQAEVDSAATETTARSRILIDLQVLRKSDVVIAFLSDDSFRCGAELAIAVQLGIPIYALLEDKGEPTLFTFELLEVMLARFRRA
jgi:nucleoside 2-deoxyribosyltransferase